MQPAIEGGRGMAPTMPATQVANDIALPEGIWRSRGYGIVLEVAPSGLRAWDVTPVSCLERQDAQHLFEHVTRIEQTADGRRFTLHRRDSITRYGYERIDRLPSCCASGLQRTDDPELNFEVLWHAFNQDYAFFRERGIDWDRQYAVFRPLVRPDTGPDELFGILSDLLAPLDDRHVKLWGNGRMFNSGWGPVLQPIVDAFHAQGEVEDFGAFWRSRLWPYHDATVSRYLGATAREFGRNVTAGRVGRNIGYLFVARMWGYAESEDDRLANQAAAARDLDDAFEYLRGVEKMIIDLRLNGGGDDAIVLDIAGRFTDVARPAFSKAARDGDRLTDAQRFEANPTGPYAFTGPAAVLVSNVTVSAGENLAMVLKTFPNVVLIGERTASVHSDVLMKTLPNGWTVTISNEVFENSDGIVYEGVGVPPAIVAGYFQPSQLEGGPDAGMEAALHLLERL